MLASLACFISLLAAPDLPELPVRAGAEIKLDGTVEAGEWSDAFTVTRDQPYGGKVHFFLKRNGPWLAIGLRGDQAYRGEMLWLYVCDATRAWVTHTLLGIARPELPPALWRRGPPSFMHSPDLGPGESPRACRVRVDVARTDGWGAEYLIRLGAMGIGHGDLRDFRGMVRLVTDEGGKRENILLLPADADPHDLSRFARLVSADDWGKEERWPPVSAEISREFDDHELLHRLFLEHEEVSLRGMPERLVVSNAVRPRSGTRIRQLRGRIESGRERNPTLPAWTYYLGRLLHEANLYDDARVVVESIPVTLRAFDPFVNLAAEHYLDTEMWSKALEICRAHPQARGMKETTSLAQQGLQAWAQELEALERDKQKPAGDRNPTIKFVTERGEIVCELFEDDAPNAVRNFMDLVLRRKFYDRLRFHEVAGGTVARTGDPSTRPGATEREDGPNWRLRPDPPKRPLLRGYIGPVPVDGGAFHGSQFFFAVAPLVRETGTVPAFGRVIKGLEIVEALEQDDRIVRVEILTRRNHGYDALGARFYK